ncbi:MAG: tetratricopeptide repeat protein [Deltaproteobacteria bacterium]|nr:tetratricopeptide repeat protein [Deltaproteobacteria bacterium]
MRKLTTYGALALIIPGLLAACGTTKKETRTVDGVEYEVVHQDDGTEKLVPIEKKAEGSKTTAGDGSTTPGDDSFTVHKVEEVKAPVYLDDIDREAQDSFREGVKIIASKTPNYAEALAKFKSAAEKDPRFVEAFFNWGMVLERTGRADEALTIYQKALEKNPGDASAQAYIAKIYLAKAREAKNFGNDAEAQRFLAQSKTLLDQLLASNPTNVAVNNAVALYYLSLDDLDTAERYVKEVLYVQPTNVTGLNTRGLINLKRGKYLIAKWIFENKVLREDPTSTEALTNLGYTYIKLDQRPLAMRYFQAALDADPENMAVRMDIAAMLLEHLDYAGALGHYDKVLAAQPTNTEAKSGRCDAIYGLGGTATDRKAQFQAAIDCYDALVKEKPSRTDLYKRIAETYQAKLQDLGKAVTYYEKYGQQAKLSPEEAQKNAEIIKTLKDIIASGGLQGGFGTPAPGPEGGSPDGTTPDGATPDGGTDDGTMPDGSAP